VCAAVAIAGVPPFSGFHSKDAILLAAYERAPWMYWVGVITAGMTAFYVWRAMFLCFFGEYRGHEHPHESPPVMTIPLAILALLSLGGGYFNVPHFLEPVIPAPQEHENMLLMGISVLAGFAGIGLAYVFYVLKPELPVTFTNNIRGLYNVVYNKYFVDEIYDAAVVKPLVSGSRDVLWQGVDAGLIDGSVNGAGSAAQGIGGLLKRLQSGNIRSYATWVVFGSVILLVAMGIVNTVGGRR
jgi:NADH-quinone oxidoreductase subunit L